MSEGKLPERAVCVTFDDGYLDNLELALPILKRCKVAATVFVATDFIDGDLMWNDRVIEAIRIMGAGVLSADRMKWLDLSYLGLGRYPMVTECQHLSAAEAILENIKYRCPSDRLKVVEAMESSLELAQQPLMMNPDQLRILHAAGIEIGAHTQSHPILTRQTAEQSAVEISGSKARLEAILQDPVSFFAYPNGRPGIDYTELHVNQVKRMGFSAALSTRPGVASSDSDVWQLPRFTPWDKKPLWFFSRLMMKRWRWIYRGRRHSSLSDG